ncbi:MAG: diaminopimelate decarboxylase [Proteobacteria bacterium]|nr:diaminopimelate decarboxylase [Pseudomonadota bacterium]
MGDARCPVEAVPEALQAAREAGLWPVKAALFHDLDGLRGRISALQAAFPDDTLHAVAIKANPVIEVLRTIVATGAGLEAASWEEVQCAVAAGCPADRIVFDSPAKTDDELRQSLALGVWINADNDQELERLQALGAPGNARVGLRVNPQLGEGSIAMTSTVGRKSKFGVPLQRAPELLKRFPFLSGLHVHTGSQGVGLALLEQAALAVAEVVEAHGLEWIDIGGGIPVRYRDDAPMPPTFAAWAKAVASIPSHIKVLTEVGRSVHAPTGWALSEVVCTKQIDGRETLVIHLGADLLLRRVYRAEQWDHEFVLLNPDGTPKQGPERPSQIAGPLCFSGDLLALDRPLPGAEPGDLLMIRDTGAYTLSMWSRHCSRGLPPSIGYERDGARLLHAGEQPEQVVDFWSL